ncbi:hypothetical protein GCM10023405_27880 [Streptomonospora salina]
MEGSSTLSVAPLSASRHTPPMKSCLGTRSTTCVSRSAKVIAYIPFWAGWVTVRSPDTRKAPAVAPPDAFPAVRAG